MNKKTIRIAGAQKSFPVGAIQKNKQTILDCFEAAEEKEADITLSKEQQQQLKAKGTRTRARKPE